MHERALFLSEVRRGVRRVFSVQGDNWVTFNANVIWAPHSLWNMNEK